MENLELLEAIDYLTKRRDKVLDYFIDKVKNYRLYTDEDLHKSLDTVLRMCRQIKELEESKITYNTFKGK